MMEILAQIFGNGAVALCIWYLASEVKGIRADIKEMRSKEECNERHGRSCERLNNLERDVREIIKGDSK